MQPILVGDTCSVFKDPGKVMEASEVLYKFNFIVFGHYLFVAHVLYGSNFLFKEVVRSHLY